MLNVHYEIMLKSLCLVLSNSIFFYFSKYIKRNHIIGKLFLTSIDKLTCASLETWKSFFTKFCNWDIPTVYPTKNPTVDCSQYTVMTACRQNGCAFRDDVCQETCEQVIDYVASGTRIGGRNIVRSISECELDCLKNPACLRYSHTGTSTCALFSGSNFF